MPQSSPAPVSCRCGHAIGHPLVHLVPVYGPFAWVWLMAGAGVTPRKARWVCRRCKHVFGETRDPAELAALR